MAREPKRLDTPTALGNGLGKLPLAVGVVVVAWLLFALVLVPVVIRAAYAGEAWPALNRIIDGQGIHPVAFYLGLWYRQALRLSGLVAVGMALVVVFWRRDGRARTWVRGRLAELPELGDGEFLIAALLLGFVSGGAEALTTSVRYWVLHIVGETWVAGEIFWMTPLASVVTLLLAAGVAILVRRGVRGGTRANGAVFLVLLGAAFFGWARTARLGLHPVALLVLALGLATLGWRAIREYPGRFRSVSRVGAILGTAAVLAWGLFQPARSARNARLAGETTALQARSDQPNVLLLIWDTARARSLSLYGYARQTTPNLDRFAQDAVVFDQAIATAPWTLPSHASLFTGRYHHEHSADRNVPLDDTHETLAEALAGRGYQTAGFIANTYWVGRGFGLDRGFQWYEDRQRVSVGGIAASWFLTRRLMTVINAIRGYHQEPNRIAAETINDAFLGWLDQTGERPFFAFLNWFDTHEPYLPPGDFGFRFGEGTPRYHWDNAWGTEMLEPFSSAELRQLRDAYDSCIYYLDHEFGRLMGELERRGILENTIVVVTADHGEELGEHQPDLLGHATNAYLNVLRVPLVIRPRGGIGTGVRESAPVSLADIPVTVLDLVDREGPNPFPGRSLIAQLGTGAEARGAGGGGAALSQAIPAPWHRSVTSWPISQGPLFSLVHPGWHYIVNEQGDERLYDLRSDPDELHNLAIDADAPPEVGEVRADLRRQLDAARTRIRAVADTTRR